MLIQYLNNVYIALNMLIINVNNDTLLLYSNLKEERIVALMEESIVALMNIDVVYTGLKNLITIPKSYKNFVDIMSSELKQLMKYYHRRTTMTLILVV